MGKPITLLIVGLICIVLSIMLASPYFWIFVVIGAILSIIGLVWFHIIAANGI